MSDHSSEPPINSATPLDVEACGRLLDDLILMLAPHDAQSIADAAQLTALKLALTGMGKDSDGWKHASALSADLTSMAKARDAWREFGYHVAHCVECGQMMYTDCDDGNALHEAARAADDVLDHPIRSAARAAQPQETSDGR